MTHSTKPISPLRQRMIDDMTLRKLSPQTQSAYIRAVKNFTRFLGQSPDAANAEDLRRYQLPLVDQGISSGNLNATLTGLKFFFETTLERREAMAKMSHVHEPRKLPVVLGLEEVTRLLQSAGSLKYQAALGVAYGAGLRASEVVHLSVTDIDGERRVIHVEQGKGQRDRYAMLSPTLLELLRSWWRHAHAHRQDTARWLAVPGTKPREPLIDPPAQSRLPSGTQGRQHRQGGVAAFSAPRLCHPPARASRGYSCHPGAPGAQELENTARYSQVAAKLLHEVKGPLEYLEIKATG